MNDLKNQHKRANGFTMIELLIVLAVIGILAAIALPVYGNYVQGAAETQVESNYEAAARLLPPRIMRVRSDLRAGRITAQEADDALAVAGVTGIIEALNPDNAKLAPENGMFAFASGPGTTQRDADGVVSVEVAGAPSTGDLAVTIYRPAYGSVDAVNQTFNW